MFHSVILSKIKNEPTAFYDVSVFDVKLQIKKTNISVEHSPYLTVQITEVWKNLLPPISGQN
jgi:hypothetical protein